MNKLPKLTRRRLVVAGAAIGGAVVVSGIALEIPRMFRHRASGQYADLVNLLYDPDRAATVGDILDAGDFANTGTREMDAMAGRLRKRIETASLGRLLAEDDRDIDRMVEADGWVIPETLAELCVLAAHSN